jgi:anti-sigma regulatory factor (Ser/Thr protein kinase)
VIRIAVEDPSQAGNVRRLTAALARSAGFDETDGGRVGIVATELATNLAKHATVAPELLAWRSEAADPPAIELLALDRGPGGDRAADWIRDGYTTYGSPGTGLGAVSRVADTFELQSAAGVGTAILARVEAGGPGHGTGAARTPGARRPTDAGAAPGTGRPSVRVGGVSVPLEGEAANGDAWAVRRLGPTTVILVADGLGHGELAAEASAAAVALFRADPLDDLAALLARMDAALRPTRGAAVALAALDPAAGTIQWASVGNVRGVLIGPDRVRGLVSQNGTVGARGPRPRVVAETIEAGVTLVVHTDGARAHWQLDAYAGLARRDPSLIAGVLYRDHRRGRDDVTIVVARVG